MSMQPLLAWTRWLYAFGVPYALQCYMALKCVRRRNFLETPCGKTLLEAVVGVLSKSSKGPLCVHS